MTEPAEKRTYYAHEFHDGDTWESYRDAEYGTVEEAFAALDQLSKVQFMPKLRVVLVEIAVTPLEDREAKP